MEAAPEVKATGQGRIDDRLQEIQQRNLPPVQGPVETPIQSPSFKQLK